MGQQAAKFLLCVRSGSVWASVQFNRFHIYGFAVPPAA